MDTSNLNHRQTQSPLVSVGLPVYNSEKTVSEALSSIMGQDYENLEIIVSDNASEDKTFDLCKELQSKDSRIKLFRNSENLGAVRNFEIVAEKATGKYFYWAAGDDWWNPSFVSTLVSALEDDEKAAVALCAIERVWPDGKKDYLQFSGEDDPKGMSTYKLLLNILPYKKEVVNKKYNFFLIGMMRTSILQDFLAHYPFVNFGERPILAAIALKHRFLFVDKALMRKRQHEKQFKHRHPEDPFKKGMKNSGPEKRLAYAYKYLFSTLSKRDFKERGLLAATGLTLAGQVLEAKIRHKALALLSRSSNTA